MHCHAHLFVSFLFFRNISLLFFLSCLPCMFPTSGGKQAGLKQIASMSSVLPFCCCFYFFWRWSIIHQSCWLPLKLLLFQPLYRRPHAPIDFVHFSFCCHGITFFSTLSVFTCAPALFFLHKFKQYLSGSVVSCVFSHFCDYCWVPFHICLPLPSSSSSGHFTPGSSKSDHRNVKTMVNENKFKQSCWPFS